MKQREEIYHMTAKEMARVKVAERLIEGMVTVKAAAEVLGDPQRERDIHHKNLSFDY